MELLDRTRCLLAVIDVQAVFLEKLPEAVRAPLVARIVWLIRAARALDIPVVAMGEDLAGNGPPLAEVIAALPPGAPLHDKHVFGLAGQPGILAALTRTGRDQAVLAGLETDVCVAQSALGLVAKGWQVAVAADACGSPDHQAGLARMAGAGVAVSTVKGVYYEWVRDLATHGRAMSALGRDAPVGL